MAGNPFPSSSRKRAVRTLRLLLAGAAAATVAAGGADDPWLDRIEPLGGRRGSAAEVTLVGRNLSAPAVLEFDDPGLSWEPAGPGRAGNLSGTIRIAAGTPLGPHVATLSTPRGRSNSRLFYVDDLPSAREAEPNDTVAQAQLVELAPQTIHGGMHALSDIDVFAFEARAGERWTFDLRSLEYGGFLENNMSLLDAGGARVAFSDDRDDYLETPFLEHRFERSGRHYLRLDQYRGPQRVNCARNCGYMLRIARLPVVEAAFPLGARPGAEVDVTLRGRALDLVRDASLVPVRRAEYYRLTFPHTIPVRTDHAGGGRLEGRIRDRAPDRLVVRFAVPADAWTGLWRLWVRAADGATDPLSFEIADVPAADCGRIEPSPAGTVCDGVIPAGAGEREHRLRLRADRPVVAETLAAQLGLPRFDTVLELFDESGTLVAEHDDLMSGQGTVIGNPDSLLRYRPPRDGTFRLVVRDRIGRSGPDMAYRLRVAQREPGFALLTDPENLNVRAGGAVTVEVLLIPEPGFDRPVDVWIDDPPRGVSAARGRFRPGQFFGPSGDGDNVVIPSVALEVAVDPGLAPGDYPLRILGREEGGREAVRAVSTLWIGPPRKRNDVRRPLEAIRLTVLEPEGPAAPGSN